MSESTHSPTDPEFDPETGETPADRALREQQERNEQAQREQATPNAVRVGDHDASERAVDAPADRETR